MRNFKPKTYEDNKKSWTNFSDLCKSCGLCLEKCPQKCLDWETDRNGYYGTPAVRCEIGGCIACGICEEHCPDQAIRVDKKK